MPTHRLVGLGLLSIVSALTPYVAATGVPASATAASSQTSLQVPKPPRVSVADVTVTENDTGLVSTFTVTLKRGNGSKVRVRWATADGTATAPADYGAASGKVVFKGPATKQTRTIQIQVKGDDLVEPAERFTLTLTKVKNGVIKRATATATIKNDDAAPVMRTLTLSHSGDGLGSISSSPAGIDCPADCTMEAAQGTTVTLTAHPNSFSDFDGWGGDCTGDEPVCVLTLTGDKTADAGFKPGLRQLTVAPDPANTGTGTVTSSAPGIDCGETCSAAFPKNDVVTLTATPDPGSQFLGWGGDCSGTGGCAVDMTHDYSVLVKFGALPTYTLNVSTTGSGSVSSDPSGIACPADCTESYTSGTSVVLTASAGTGYSFGSWTGCASVNGDQCTVSMTQARSVSAQFTINQYQLSVTKVGSGAGTVTGTGISCGSTCSAMYSHGTSVVLTATASSGSTFAGWSGGCTGLGSCQVSMTQARSVVASFNTSARGRPGGRPVVGRPDHRLLR